MTFCGKRDFAGVMNLMVLRWKTNLDYPGGSNGGSETKMCNRSRGQRCVERFEGFRLLALKMEEVMVSQGLQVASRNKARNQTAP